VHYVSASSLETKPFMEGKSGNLVNPVCTIEGLLQAAGLCVFADFLYLPIHYKLLKVFLVKAKKKNPVS